MEDQRNWIDASFKTFCTPLRLPFPLEIAAGTRITQAIELRLHGDTQSVSVTAVNEPQHIRLSSTARRFTLPPIGFGLSEHALTPREVERLAKLRPAHLRVDLKLAESDAAQTFARACHEAQQLATPLEIALFCRDNAAAELQSLVALLNQHQPRVARWLIFDTNAKASSARSLELARQALQTYGAPLGGSTNADFYQLNQFRPPAALLDFVAFSMNPQMHAFDDLARRNADRHSVSDA